MFELKKNKNLLDQLHKKSQRLEVNNNYLKEQTQLNKKYEKSLESKMEIIDRLELEKQQLSANYNELEKNSAAQIRDLSRKVSEIIFIF